MCQARQRETRAAPGFSAVGAGGASNADPERPGLTWGSAEPPKGFAAFTGHLSHSFRDLTSWHLCAWDEPVPASAPTPQRAAYGVNSGGNHRTGLCLRRPVPVQGDRLSP